jgi:hypothetical protein
MKLKHRGRNKDVMKERKAECMQQKKINKQGESENGRNP